MKIKYTVREEDLLETQLLIASKSKKRRTQRWTASILTMLILFTYIICRRPNEIKWIPTIAIIIFAGGFIFFLIPQIYRRHYAKQIKIHFADIIGDTVELQITSDFIETRDKSGETKMKLTAIKKVYETKNLFVIQSENESYLTVAKKDIDSVKFRDRLRFVIQQ